MVKLAFSPNGLLLASASEDKTVALWEVASRQSLGHLIFNNNQPWYVNFDSESSLLAAYDRTIVRWDVDPANWQTLACQRVNRNFTRAEWIQVMNNNMPYQLTCPELPPGD